MLQFDAAGSGDDDEMVFELLHDGDAVFGDVGEVIEEEGVFFVGGGLDGQFAKALDAFAGG